MNSSDFYDFLLNPALVSLMERVKISDDVLDVLSLSENQHSDMLAWCLNPNEGHAQGDAVIKDFLFAVYTAGVETNKYDNKKFFARWTPGKIQTSNFGAAFLTREFSLQVAETKSNKRLDLFLIDPVNKIIVTIENKFGAKISERQLDSYVQQVGNKIGGKIAFRDYDFSYVVLDSELDLYSEEDLAKLGNRWALLNYKWLERSATRARLHLDRDNQAAQLLMAYCQKQTGWESPKEQQISELSATLASQHEGVIKRIQRISRLKPTEWTPSEMTGVEGEMLFFIQQNRQLCEHIIQARGIGHVRSKLKKRFEGQDLLIESGRTSFNLTTGRMRELGEEDLDSMWVLYVNIFRDKSQSSDEESRFQLRLIWNEENLPSDKCDAQELRKAFTVAFKDLGKFPDRPYRKIVIGKNLSADTFFKKAVDVITLVEATMQKAEQNGVLILD